VTDQLTWYKDEETWRRYKEICEDKDHFGPSYLEWMQAVQSKIDGLAKNGIFLKKVETDPERFLAWCQQHGHPLNGQSRGLYLAESFTGDSSKH
jgi:hypothetical protein